MKKNFFFLLFMLLSLSTLAQSGLPRNFERTIAKMGLGKDEPLVKFGIKAGVNLSGIHTKDFVTPWGVLTDKIAPPKYGVIGGIVVDFRISDYFSIQPELLATTKGCIREGSVSSSVLGGSGHRKWQVNLLYLELPLFFVGKIPVGYNNIFLGIGPYIAYGIYGKGKDLLEVNTDSVVKTTDEIFTGANKLFNPLDIGAFFCTGFEWDMGLFLNVGYSRGLVSIAGDNEGKVVNNGINVSVGFKF